jgi:hypothetical protein
VEINLVEYKGDSPPSLALLFITPKEEIAIKNDLAANNQYPK